jgi:hypothetical protein
MKNMTHQDRSEAIDALISWFESQSIRPRDAAIICAILCGTLATKDSQIAKLALLMQRTKEEME